MNWLYAIGPWLRRAEGGNTVFPATVPTADGDTLHVGRRSVSLVVTIAGKPHVKKVFAETDNGMRSFANEKLAFELFSTRDWMAPWVQQGPNWFIRPMYPASSRLDLAFRWLYVASRMRLGGEAPSFLLGSRVRLAGEVLSIILDIYAEHYAQRDIHARNLFLSDNHLKLVDFETMCRYPADRFGDFATSYDVTGLGLDSPYLTDNMGYASKSPISASQVLGIPVRVAMRRLREILKEQLRDASRTFKTHSAGRHLCKAQRIYNSFTLPGLSVLPSEAQRNSAHRLARFRLDGKELSGSSILDMGSHVGGMLFEAQRYQPARCLGLEYDVNKVAIARRVAAFCALHNTSFVHGDLDATTAATVGGPYDIVLCLAVDQHVRDRARLYRLLGEVTRGVLLFEGNVGSDPSEVESALLSAGLHKVDNLGYCDDDCRPENNRRPLLKAWK